MERNWLLPGVDRISDLPSNVIDHILACLPLKDAVRTSTLSKNWREKWHTLPHIIVDENFFHERSRRNLEGIINYILTRNEGNIEKFFVSVDEVKECYNLKLWIWRLSQKSIQELSLVMYRGQRNEVPSSLFSCQQLRKLSLCHLEIRWAHSFEGFPNLIILQLSNVNIETSVFERLISSCPLLEQLFVRNLSCTDHLHINGLCLKYFCFDGDCKSMSFNTPLLEALNIKLYRMGPENNPYDLRFKLHGLPRAITGLYVHCPFQRFLAAGDTFTEVSTYYRHLRTLVICAFCFERVDEVSLLLSLIGSALSLQILDIKACSCQNEGASEPIIQFWEEQNHSLFSFNLLQRVAVRSFHGKDYETRFIQFLLANSPVLEQITVECMTNPNFNQDEVQAALLSFCGDPTKLNFIKGIYNPPRVDSSDSDDNSNSSHSSF